MIIIFCFLVSCCKKSDNKDFQKVKINKTIKPIIKDKLLNSLSNELKKPGENVVYDTIKLERKTIIFPKINNLIIQNEIEKDILKSKKTKLYNREYIVISYKVKFYTAQLVSILKESSLENSSPSDFLMYDSFNYLINDDKVYVVGLSEKYFDFLQSNLWKIIDYNEYYSYVDRDIKIHNCLIFKKNSAFLYDIFSIKRFNEETLPLNISDGNFKFKQITN